MSGSLMNLGDLISVKTNNPDADFWVVRRGTPDAVGRPSRTFSEHAFGITVTARDRLDPNYLFYMFEHLSNTGLFSSNARGTTRLVSIRTQDITGIPISA